MRRWTYILFLLFSALACTHPVEEDQAWDDSALEGKQVLVTFTVPDVRMTSATKALGENTDLQDMYLAVCGNSGYLKEYVKATPLGKMEEKYNYTTYDKDNNPIYHSVDQDMFQVKLAITTSKRTIHFLGNGPDEMPFGYDTSVLPSQLCNENQQAYWQKVDLPSIGVKRDNGDPVQAKDGNGDPIANCYEPDEATENALKEIPLIRNFAKITVISNKDESNFEIKSYAVINYPKRGTLVPYSAATRFDFAVGESVGYQKCTFANLEDDLKYPGNLPSGVPFDTSIPDAAWFTDPSQSGGRVIAYDQNQDKDHQNHGFYLYERCEPTVDIPPTAVIVYGHFKKQKDSAHPELGYDEGDYYYKIDLMEDDQYYPIYRNFRYKIDITSIQSKGHNTPVAAAHSAGSADVSADINTRSLSDISDGTARLVIYPFMEKAYVTAITDEKIYALFYEDAFEDETSPDKISVDRLPMADESAPILENVHMGDEQGVEISGVSGKWREIFFSLGTPGSVTRSQTLRVTATYYIDNIQDEAHTRRLYRDVVITLQKRQPLKVKCTPSVAASLYQQVDLDISIPHSLNESLFPLRFQIETEAGSLTPEPGVNLPVISGPSIISGIDKPSFHFEMTLSWSEYLAQAAVQDEFGNSWKTFTLPFRTTRKKSATTIYVKNDQNYFLDENEDAKCSFTNTAVPEDFSRYFYVQADPGNENDCVLKLNNGAGIECKKVDDEDWASPNSSGISLAAGEKIYIRANKLTWGSGSLTCTGGNFKVGGNIASLIVGEDILSNTDDPPGAGLAGVSFEGFFKNMTNLVDASALVLPMRTLGKYAYKNMFSGCTGLTGAPTLPNTGLILGQSSCESMFQGCIGLTSVPDMTISELGQMGCYQMFFGCTGIESAANISLAAASLPTQACQGMFSGCTSLTSAPNLSSVTSVGTNGCQEMFRQCYKLPTFAGLQNCTSVGKNGFMSMFYDCSLLNSAIDLSQLTTINTGICYNMFYNCQKLTTPATLPTMLTATDNCFRAMFRGCSSLTSAPVLSATTLAANCYYDMFYGCTSLTTAPELPAETLEAACYYRMFYGCTALTEAPVLPAEALVSNCYYQMFLNCSNLLSVTCLATSGINTEGSTTYWLSGVPNTAALHGTFIFNPAAHVSTDNNGSGDTWPRSAHGIPTYWITSNGLVPVFPDDPFDDEEDF